ncbi:hypothetical protein [Microbacterium sp. zg.Y909]|uniref:hypothetical protein n=1 Tax=Microbacterium sp. zg.Y909 TaxID=2969413 RepID=UPI00214C7081|nr:hypothetical protein [Microbacterium sp. zg.Y909]MCR2827702.1 hypothetical protein [Microbacterium sp. zg.Y909]
MSDERLDAAGPPPAAPPLRPRPRPRVEEPSPDVVAADEAPRLPGEHRGGFQRLPTAPVEVDVADGMNQAEREALSDTGAVYAWIEPQRPVVGIAAWALGFAIAGLVISWFVGWGFPIGVAAAVTAVIALRRPLESRSIALWALVLALLSVLYSAGWLVWAANTANIFA